MRERLGIEPSSQNKFWDIGFEDRGEHQQLNHSHKNIIEEQFSTTTVFSILKFHIYLFHFSKDNLYPFLSTQFTILAGFPTTIAKSGTSLVTTAPAPIKEYFPNMLPQIIVAFAPIEADFLTKVFYKILSPFGKFRSRQ